MLILKAINNLFYLFYLIIIIRIFLTWIPNVNWDAQPIKSIRIMTDFYLDFFRKFIPCIGGLDFSPIIALIALQIIQVLITDLVAKIVI